MRIVRPPFREKSNTSLDLGMKARGRKTLWLRSVSPVAGWSNLKREIESLPNAYLIGYHSLAKKVWFRR